MYAIDYLRDAQPTTEQIDPIMLQSALSHLSDEELTQLEDDLDFCNFAGVPSKRLLEVLEKVVELDDGWKQLLKKNNVRLVSVPKAY